MQEIWKVVLEISTLLGGLAAVVFFYDRFSGIKAWVSKVRRSKLLSKGLYSRPVTLGILGHCFLSAMISSWIGYRYGAEFQMGFGFLACLPSWGLSHLLETKHYDGIDAVFLAGAVFTLMGGILASLFGILFYYLVTGDGDLLHYTRSSSAVMAGLFNVIEAIAFTYLFNR